MMKMFHDVTACQNQWQRGSWFWRECGFMAMFHWSTSLRICAVYPWFWGLKYLCGAQVLWQNEMGHKTFWACHDTYIPLLCQI